MVHDISSQVDIQPIAAVQDPTGAERSRTLCVEVLNKTRQGQTLVVDLSAQRPSGPTALALPGKRQAKT